MARNAVCYTATAGYLFSTVVSAIQARAHSDVRTEIYIWFFGQSTSDEYLAFSAVCTRNQIELLSAPLSALGGAHPQYARFFLDKVLPSHVQQVLYLDGDTQIVGDIDPLIFASLPEGGALAARDPMVFARRANPSLGAKIDRWWDQGRIPTQLRDRYVNSGVLRISRADIASLREAMNAMGPEQLTRNRFNDQDVLNIAFGERITIISMSWNFPGFLLDTQMVALAPPRIIHFMSSPRPWNAALRPWGNQYHLPYVSFVDENPGVAPYWPLLNKRLTAKYILQQRYKFWTERPSWQTQKAQEVVQLLENDTRRLIE